MELNELKSYFLFDGEKYYPNQEFLSVLKKYIKNDKRVEHSLSVANLCFEVAKSNKLDNPFKYYFAGIVHDIGKGLTIDELNFYIEYYFKEYMDLPPVAYHAFAGTIILSKEFLLMDEEILDAIKFHCTGKAYMSTLAKIVYSCDKIDPLRGYNSSYMIDAMLREYKSGFKLVLKENKKYFEKKFPNNKEAYLNRLTKSCFDYYLD